MHSENGGFFQYRPVFLGLEWLYSAVGSSDAAALNRRLETLRAAAARQADFQKGEWKSARDFPQYIPIASVDLAGGGKELFGCPEIEQAFPAPGQSGVLRLPYALDIDKDTNILAESDGKNAEDSKRFLRDILWAFLAFVPATKLHISVLDCESMGSSIAAFFDFKRQNPDLFDRDICTDREMVYDKLARLNRQITDCIQNKLGSRYASLMEYNRKNPAGSEPLQLLMINDFPSGFDARSVDLLQNILKNGGKCGIYVLLHYNRDIPFSRYENLEGCVDDLRRYAYVLNDKNFPAPRVGAFRGGKLAFDGRETEWFAAAYAQAAEKIKRQGILFDNVLDPEPFARSAASSLEIPIGIGDGGGTVSISFGKGSSHHALIAGATGSGKSQLLHTMIVSAMMHYSPDEVNLYLMDFKNGTEFKIYDSYRLPHIKLLALDAMQEFGESILEELLHEVDRRAEQFKQANVSKMADYISMTGKPMPRILVIMDEFQQLFNSAANRQIAAHCAELAKRIVTEGRSYGIHLLMATQSTKIISSLSIDMGTIEQMRIRIGLKCNEDDARFLFKENDGKALEMMKGPIGTAVLNQEYTEGENRKFRAAYCDPDDRGAYLETIAEKFSDAPCEKRTFEGSSTVGLLEAIAKEDQPADDPVLSVAVGECIKVAPPLAIRFGKQKTHNILVCGADEKMAANLFHLLSWRILRQPSARLYCIDGDLLVDEGGSMPYYNVFRRYGERFKLAESRGDILRFIHEVYDLYKEKKKRATKETVFVGIRNFQFLDIVKQMIKGEAIDESEYLDADELPAADDAFAADGGFDFGVGGGVSSADPQDASGQLRKLVADGTAYGIHFILTSLEYQSVKENMYYGENILSKFPERFVFSLNDADADALIPGVSVAALTGNTVCYTDSVKETCQVKPYVFPGSADLEWFILAEPAQRAYAAGAYETALQRYRTLAEDGYAEAQYRCGLLYEDGEGTPADRETALQWFEKAAAQGHADAQYRCGLLYYKGEGTTADRETALQWFEKAAAQGHKEAQFLCGEMYYYGRGTAKDYAKALPWYEKAAVQGHRGAQYGCGWMYAHGQGTPTDAAKGLQWLEKAAAQGHSDAQYNCGLLYYKGNGTSKDHATALQWFEKAAAQGHKDAQYYCGWMYREGQGTTADAVKGLQWFEKAAAQGEIDSQTQCGFMYLEGKGTTADAAKALQWFEKAAAQQDVSAQSACGAMYHDGIGTSVDFDKALQWYEKAAAQGFADAQYACGAMYEEGEGTTADPVKALQWYEKAAAQGHRDAQHACGYRYYYGKGTPVDKKKALPWFEKAAAQGHSVAQYFCGWMCEHGEGTTADPVKALQWYEKAAAQGHKNAQYRCGEMYYYGKGTQKDHAKALQWYGKAAAQGYADAQYSCGWMYEKGEGTPADPVKALLWYEKAAAQGHKDAQYRCAWMYYEGKGTTADATKALQWFEKAAAQGHADAQYRCGWRYQYGKGTSPDAQKALQWYEKAAAQGHDGAQYSCGRMYEKGQGTAADFDKALQWYEKAAAQGHADAQYACGEMYVSGKETTPDFDKALQWYEKAAAQGHKDAQYSCAWMYYEGKGTTADAAKALRWFEKAAAQGHADAQYRCGWRYQYGKGTTADPVKALQWYEKSAAQGHKNAQYSCGEMYYYGQGTQKNHAKALQWYEKAAAQGVDDAIFACGKLYYQGEGIPHDMNKAVATFQKAAQLGNVKAMYNLGVMYYERALPSATAQQAFAWFEQAADKGHIKAQYKCAEMLYNGEVPRDKARARKWLQCVAAQTAEPLLQKKAQAYLARYR